MSLSVRQGSRASGQRIRHGPGRWLNIALAGEPARVAGHQYSSNTRCRASPVSPADSATVSRMRALIGDRLSPVSQVREPGGLRGTRPL
jgi:hypothetical protein